MPGCNDTFNRSKLQEGQACACYSPIDPDTSERVDCSSLIDEVTNQALHDKAQKIFKSGKERKAVVEYREECRAMWLASKRGTAAADKGEAAQEHSTGASSAESAAEGHGLGISDSSASDEDMLEVSTDSDSDWRNGTDTTDSESEAERANHPTGNLHLAKYFAGAAMRAFKH